MALGGALQGAAGGAGAGSMFGPYGTAIGAGAGFLGGLFGGGRKRVVTPMPALPPPGYVQLQSFDPAEDPSYFIDPTTGHRIRWETGNNPGWRDNGAANPELLKNVRNAMAADTGGAGGTDSLGLGTRGMEPLLRQFLKAAGFDLPGDTTAAYSGKSLTGGGSSTNAVDAEGRPIGPVMDAQGNPIDATSTTPTSAQEDLIRQLFGEQLGLGKSDLEATRARGSTLR